MNRRDFVLTALGASGAIAAAGAAVLDIGPQSSGEGGPANDSDGHGATGTPTATATEPPQGSPTATEPSTATDTESPPGASTESGTPTTGTTNTETQGATRTETQRDTATETPGSTGTGTETGTSATSTPGPRDGIEVEGTSQSGDDTRVVVELTNTNDYAVYVEAAVTWQFQGGETDSQTRAGVIAPAGSDTRQYSTDQRGIVTEWNVTLPTVQRI